MFKYALLLAFLLTIFSCCSNDVKNPPREVVLKYNNGNTALEGKLNGENKKIGEWKTYFPDGNLFTRINYDASHEDFYKLYQAYNESGRLVREAHENETEDNNHSNFIEKYYTNEGILRYEILTDIYVEYDEGEAYYDYYQIVKKFYQNGNIMKAEKLIDYELDYTDWYDVNGEFQGRVYSSDSNYKVESEN